ncbi:hypothetical protein LUZ60_010663 [Juncus effusus]|nr:hypothetical protein LUZ60_010663 [Juncus effusus]
MKIFFLICLLLGSSTFIHASQNYVEETCKNVTTSKKYYEFCLTSLQVVPGSQTADVYNLTVMLAELTKTNFTYAYTKYLEVSKQDGWSNTTLSSFHVCLDIYSDTSQVDAAVDQAKTRDYNATELMMTTVITDADTCVEAFEEIGEKTPIPEVDNNVSRLAGLSLFFASLCQNN